MSWLAQLHLQYRRADQRTVLHHRHNGPLRIFKSLYPEGPSVCHNVVVHPPGGLVQGDHLEINVEVAEGAHGLLSTPGATRFYKCTTDEQAEQVVTLQLAKDARLEWLPLETIAYPACRASNRLEMSLAEGAELILWDVLSLGLPAAAQSFDIGRIEQRLEWPGVWLERARIDAKDHRLLNSPVGLDGQSTLGTLALVCGTPLSRQRKEHLLEACRDLIESHPLAPRCGVTCPNDHVLVVRALAPQVEPVMQLWQTLWGALRRLAWDMGDTPPRIWQV